jgi:hypothetical protein
MHSYSLFAIGDFGISRTAIHALAVSKGFKDGYMPVQVFLVPPLAS